MKESRITLFAGHYGSGKTNICVNYAIQLKSKFENVAIADLDIVNPYFRTKDAEDRLKQLGIRLIASDFANSNVELPGMPAGAMAIFDDKKLYSAIDVGGDDRSCHHLSFLSNNVRI